MKEEEEVICLLNCEKNLAITMLSTNDIVNYIYLCWVMGPQNFSEIGLKFSKLSQIQKFRNRIVNYITYIHT